MKSGLLCIYARVSCFIVDKILARNLYSVFLRRNQKFHGAREPGFPIQVLQKTFIKQLFYSN